MNSSVEWRLPFSTPLPEAAAGMPLHNGTLGAVAWGERGTVRFTLNRPDFATLLQAGGPDEADEADEAPLLPLGRLDLELSPWEWQAASLNLETGEAEVDVVDRSRAAKLRALVLAEAPVLCVRVTGLDGTQVSLTPRPPDAPETLDLLHQHGFPRAHPFDLAEFAGWVQETPGGRTACVAWVATATPGGLVLYATAVFGEDPPDARRVALATLEGARAQGYTSASLRTFSLRRKWWQEFGEAARENPAGRYAGVGDTAPRLGQGSPSLFPCWLEGTAITGQRRSLPAGLPSSYRPQR